MANEFIARKGLISSGSIDVSGSVTASFFKGDGSQLTNLPSTMGLNIDSYEFISNGATTSYDLTEIYDIDSLIVTVDGLTFNPTDDYTIVGTNIQFTTAPLSQSLIFVRAFINATENAVGSFTGSLLGTSSFAVTASYALTANLPAGVVSSSTQFNDITSPFTGSFTGSFTGNGYALNSLPGGTDEKGPALTYSASLLTQVTYDSGNYKTFAYTSGLLTQSIFYQGSSVITKTFFYNIDNSLSSITQTEA